jgi:hypothetical protein
MKRKDDKMQIIKERQKIKESTMILKDLLRGASSIY